MPTWEDEIPPPHPAVAERDALRMRVGELEGAIRDVLSQQWDDICWLDAYTKLAHLVGVEFKPELLDDDRMLANCRRFIASMRGGCPYRKDAATERIKALEIENNLLRGRLDDMYARLDQAQGRAV